MLFFCFLHENLSDKPTRHVKLFSLFKNPAPSRLLSVNRWQEVFQGSSDFAKQREWEKGVKTSQEFWCPPPQILLDFTRRRFGSRSCLFWKMAFSIFLLFFLNGRNQLNVEWCSRAIQTDPGIPCLHLNQFWMPKCQLSCSFLLPWKKLELFSPPFLWWS
ncbi:hypothetical protein L345_07580, partial [Ophiophagus hannah]